MTSGGYRSVSHWWVNQSVRYRIERSLGHLFCPTHDSAGRQPAFYRNMTLLSPGDICLNYASPAIRSFCVVTARAVEGDRPRLPDETPREQRVPGIDRRGYLVEVEYISLEQPIQRDDIPIKWRAPAFGPFDGGKRAGFPRMGYMWPAREPLIANLEKHFGVSLSP